MAFVLWYTSATGSEPAPLLLDESFEHTDLYHDGWWQKSGNDLGRVADEVAREGGRAARFHVALDTPGDFRSEVATIAENPAGRAFTIGEEYWYGISIMPARGLKPSPYGEIVFQFHSTPDLDRGETWTMGIGPPVALISDGGRWSLNVKGDARPAVLDAKPRFTKSRIDLGTVHVGQWTDWVFRIKWSYGDDGLIEVWKNGEHVYRGTHPNCYNDAVGPYLKFGVYAWYLRDISTGRRDEVLRTGANDRVYFHDAVRIADARGSIAAVSPRTPRVHLVLVGDSTVASEGGWGDTFATLLRPTVVCTNAAQNGQSTKSYLGRGLWHDRALAARPTHVFIQFGHNDIPGKGPQRETDAQTTYREYLHRYIDEARAAGAVPVLVTSVTRRNFRDGELVDTLLPYVEAMRSVAEGKNTPLLDLHARSVEAVMKLGPDGSAELGPRNPDGTRDNTHLAEPGKVLTAGLVADELRRVLPDLAKEWLRE